MNLSKARELREQRAKTVKDAQAILDQAAITTEDRAKFDTMMADSDLLKADIDRHERAETLATETRVAPPAAAVGGGAGETKAQKEERFRAAWQRSMKFDGPAQYGFRGISAEDRALLAEYRDMGTGGGNALQGTGGGYFVPVGFVDTVESALKYYGPMLDVSTIMETATGQPLPYPTDNDTTVVGARLAEGAQVSTADVTLGNITFGAWKYSTNLVKVSIELLQDSAFDMEKFLAVKFGERLGRALNIDFTVGAGSGGSAPNGIVTAATAGPTAVGSSTNDGSSATGGLSLGSDDFINLEHSVDPWYRRGAMYLMHDTTLQAVRKVKDKYGRPLWQPGVAVNAPDTINGYGYGINNDMAVIAVNAKTVLFGQIKKYLIRQVKELSVLRLVERFADYGQVAFIGFARYDGNLLDAGTHPVKYLVQAAS
jgi:HK97 family phage major capsid protein